MSRTRDALAYLEEHPECSPYATAIQFGIAPPTLYKALAVRRARVCLWRGVDGLWDTSCGHQCRVAGTLADAGLAWCPYCGKEISHGGPLQPR